MPMASATTAERPPANRWDRVVIRLAVVNVALLLLWTFLNCLLDWNPWWMVVLTKVHVYGFVPAPVWFAYGCLRFRKSRRTFNRLGLLASPALLLCLILYGRLWIPRPSPVAEMKTLSVLTYNVLNGQPNLDRVVAIILRLDPDVVCLQEVTERHAEELTSGLGSRYPHRLFGTPHPGGTTALFSRHQWIRAGELPMPAGRPAVWAEVVTDSDHITVVAAHLMHYWRGEITGLAMIPDYFAGRTRMQEAQIEELNRAFGTNAGPVIIGMDGNLVPHSRSWRILGGTFVDSAFASGWHPSATHPPGTRNDLRPLKLDYLWARNVRPTDIVVADDTGGSDHPAVLGSFGFERGSPSLQ